MRSGQRVEESLKAVGMLEYQTPFAKQAVRRTEAACGNCGRSGDGAEVYRA